MSEEVLPTPTPEQAIEDLRDDGFWPQAMALDILLRESRYHQQEIETLLNAKRRSEDQRDRTMRQRDQLREALSYAVDNPEFNSEEFDAIARAALKATEEG